MFRSRQIARTHSVRRPRFGQSRLRLLNLEDRCVPTTFTVINNNDSGAGSLRQALIDAQNNGQTDMITFDTGLVTSPLMVTGGELAYIGTATEGKSLDISWPGAGKLTIQS